MAPELRSAAGQPLPTTSLRPTMVSGALLLLPMRTVSSESAPAVSGVTEKPLASVIGLLTVMLVVVPG